MLKLLQMSVSKPNDAFLDYLCQFTDVNEQSMEELLVKARASFQVLHLKKNDFFVKENEICEHFCFVESGILQHSIEILDEEKTMTDKDIDSMMNKIIGAYEKELGAEIRK